MKNLLILICSLFSFSFLGCKPSSQDEGLVQISPKDLNGTLQKKEVQLVDVRTPKEFRGGYIKSAVNINYFSTDFGKDLQETLNKDKPVYIYCRSGKRSGKSVKLFRKYGFKKIYNLKGGFLSWKDEGFQIFK